MAWRRDERMFLTSNPSGLRKDPYPTTPIGISRHPRPSRRRRSDQTIITEDMGYTERYNWVLDDDTTRLTGTYYFCRRIPTANRRVSAPLISPLRLGRSTFREVRVLEVRLGVLVR